jgi:hypothetical protein
MLAAACALLGGANAYTLTPDVLGVRTAVRSSLRLAMMADEPVPLNPVWGDAREGKPFGDADRDEASGLRTVGGVREAVEAYQPRGLSDATVIKPQYIGTDDDEPWHASSRQTVAVTKAALEDGFEATLPFVAAESALDAAVRAAKSAGEIKSAISTATSSGARGGSPSIVAAEKVLAAFEKNDEKAAEKAKPKAPKVGAQGKGWDNMSRSVAKVHDNSVA